MFSGVSLVEDDDDGDSKVDDFNNVVVADADRDEDLRRDTDNSVEGC